MHPQSRRVALLCAVGGTLLPVTADVQGGVCSEVLGALFATVAGRLRITWEDGVADL